MRNANNGNSGAAGRLNGAMSKSTLSLMGPSAAAALASRGHHQRKTSAEIVSEARNMLAGVGMDV